ncbi:hypothetical protein RJ641_033929 [Dillenia turbinata]|uniref:Uncharacterized protein n=1 Tax=Dillenia turbinata TaxID=194707 RepID=A0AAN8ZDR2_9MAGN
MSLPKRSSFLPLLFFFLLILSLSALFFFYSCSYRSSLHFSNSLSFNPISSPSSPNFILTIKLLTFNRLQSLSRCLLSLSKADYAHDRVNLHIYIDHFSHVENNTNGSANLENSRKILNFVDRFAWNFGEKLVHYRTGNVGLQAQWLEAWWPSSDDEFAFVVEDDLEVSPLYYKFLKNLITNYYYNDSNFSPSIYGASLQRPRFVPGKHGNKLQVDSGTRLFLYQLVGTWGQLLFPKPWKEFRLWYDVHKTKGIKPLLPGMVTTGWYKKLGERIWTPWFIKFVHSRGYFNIYTNFLQERALSISHRDAGVNYGKTVGPDSNLLDESNIDFDLLEAKPLSDLKWYDFCFSEVHPGREVRNFDELGPVLQSVSKRDTVILVSIFWASEPLIRNLLCHFEKHNIRNFILYGPNSDFTLDLARRGHPVIDANSFLDSSGAYKLIGSEKSNAEQIKEILTKMNIIKKCLSSGLSSWLVEANLLSVNGAPYLDSLDPSSDIFVGKNTGLLFIRSSSFTRKIWSDKIINKVTAKAHASASQDLFSRDGRYFVYIIEESLARLGAKIKMMDESSFIMNLGTGNDNHPSLGDGKKMVSWSSLVSFDLIKKQLVELGMWIIDDDDLSCASVICHQL